MSHYTHYEQLFSGNNYNINNSFEFDNLLTMMNSVLPADYWVAALLHYFDKFNTNRILDFAKKLDNKFSSDWILSLTPTERIENVNSILKAIDSSTDFNKLIDNEDHFQIQFENLESCFNGDIYGRRFARYLLYKLDYLFHGNTSKLTIPDTISVEHILPQTPGVKS